MKKKPNHPPPTKHASLDLALGVHCIAWNILHLLKREEEFTFKDVNSVYPRAWYNGRECCINLEALKYEYRNALFITFGECRNSDHIFVDAWIDVPTMNGHDRGPAYEVAYKNRRFFDANDVAQVVGAIQALVIDYAKTGTCNRR